MKILINSIFFMIIFKVKCQQVLYEELKISTQNAEEKINIKKANIDRRFLEDLDDYEWHVAHLKGDVFDGRRDCMGETFADKARRYRKMLKNDGARVKFVSADPISIDPADLQAESCRVADDPLTNALNETISRTSANIDILPTTAVEKETEGTTPSIKVDETTPQQVNQATTMEPKEPIPQKKVENDTGNVDSARRASEYMFSSIEYYDESIEFDNDMCPDAVEIIELEIDQIRSYDLECELAVEWRSLD